MQSEYFKSFHGTYLSSGADGRVFCGKQTPSSRLDVQSQMVEGTLKKKSSGAVIGSKWHVRHFKLIEHTLYWCKKGASEKSTFDLTGPFSITLEEGAKFVLSGGNKVSAVWCLLSAVWCLLSAACCLLSAVCRSASP
jgi:hypothetical protein